MEIKKYNLLIIFDYIYYAIAYQIYKWYDEDVNEFFGIIGLSYFQQLNIILILNFFNIHFFADPQINSLFSWLIGCTILIAFNSIRYKKIITYDELHEKWANDTRKVSLIKKSLVLFYLVISTIVG